jgi:hypothetical protein
LSLVSFSGLPDISSAVFLENVVCEKGGDLEENPNFGGLERIENSTRFHISEREISLLFYEKKVALLSHRFWICVCFRHPSVLDQILHRFQPHGI